MAAPGSGTAIEVVAVEKDVMALVAGAVVWAAEVGGVVGAASEGSASGVSARARAP